MALCRAGLVDAVGLAWPRLERSGPPELDGGRSQPGSRAAEHCIYSGSPRRRLVRALQEGGRRNTATMKG
jgi:hypothetical protein